MCNMEIRIYAKEKCVKLWEVAEYLHFPEASFSRKLRHELPQQEREKAIAAIDAIASSREA